MSDTELKAPFKAVTTLTKKRASATQDNQLIESCYTMTLNEKRLLMLGISKVDPTAFPDSTDTLEFDVTQEEWSHYYPSDNAYRELKRAAKLLRGRFIRLHPKSGIEHEINWVDGIKYYHEKGRVNLRFGRSIQIRLSGMLEQFTKVDLLQINRLNSLYSIRLYETLSQFRSTGFRKINIEDFRFMMATGEAYTKLYELKRNVLFPSLKEVNQKTDLQVDYEDIKKGRKVIGFKFFFADKQQTEMDI